ncbi:MAG: tetratricopeptide repeat protein [Oscillospiraceae bacterium]|nr:tetratricopeptide repeat protein [Oscillospiraceae bacterium]
MLVAVDEQKIERLCQRLALQQANAFFCVVANAMPLQKKIAEEISSRLPEGETQIIDFGDNMRFSCAYLREHMKKTTKHLLLVNFNLGCGDMEEVEFLQAINLSRDALAELPCALVFIMPSYFRIELARRAPDFNSFFCYHVEFVTDTTNAPSAKIDYENSYSETNRELLNYYLDGYAKVKDMGTQKEFETLLKILTLNTDLRVLHSIDLKRFYKRFNELLPKYKSESENSASDIAKIYNGQGEYAKALEFYEKVLEINEKTFGKEHPETATIYNNMAAVYVEMGDYAKAFELYEKTLKIDEKVFGKEHQKTATTYNNMAVVYDNQGDYVKALEFHEKASEIQEKSLGKEHPETATTYNNMAAIYNNQGDDAKAISFCEKALAIYERVLGKEHPNTATLYGNMALLYDKQGNYAKALKFYEKALKIRERVLGKEHPYTADSAANLEYIKSHLHS